MHIIDFIKIICQNKLENLNNKQITKSTKIEMRTISYNWNEALNQLF
jgi:hypothetical protein